VIKLLRTHPYTLAKNRIRLRRKTWLYGRFCRRYGWPSILSTTNSDKIDRVEVDFVTSVYVA